MFRSLPPLAQLRAFAALAEAGSMSAAGERLNVSHAAISQQARALEEHLGARLFVRDGRGVRLTAEGQRLGEVLREAFGAIAREVDALTGADADRPLQITSTPSFAARWLLPRLALYRADHPGVDIMLNPTAKRADPEPGGIDLAIRYGHGTGGWAGLEAEMFLPTRFVIAAATSLVGDRKISRPGDLLDYPWLQEIGTNEAKHWLTAQGVTERRVRGMTDLPGNLIQDALRAGEGIAATALTFIADEVARGEIRVLFDDADPDTGYFLVTRPGPKRPVVKEFMRWLRRQARAEAASDSAA